MLRRLGSRRRNFRLALAASLLIGGGVGIAITPGTAYADPHSPPGFPTKCPVGVAPPPGYPNPPPTTPWTYPPVDPNTRQQNQSFQNWYAPTPSGKLEPISVGHQYGPGRIQFKAPFRAIVGGRWPNAGSIKFLNKPGTPTVDNPAIYGAICGTANVPQLTGSIPPSGFNMATPNVYVDNLEAVPVSTSFGTAQTPISDTVLPTPAHNGGLDAELSGSVTSTVNTLGMSCSLTLPADLSTLQGDPVTGPPTNGYAKVVATVHVPPLSPSPGCPAAVVGAFNKLLGLNSGGGTAELNTPFCFDFELNGNFTATPNSVCPWPAA